MPITLFLVALLGAVFLKGFKEAIGIAVTLVSAYFALNLIVVIKSIDSRLINYFRVLFGHGFVFEKLVWHDTHSNQRTGQF